MRTNIDIDDALLAQAMRAGAYTTKKETVEAGLRLLARQAAYHEVLKWRGKLKWEGDESIDWVKASAAERKSLTATHMVQDVTKPYRTKHTPATKKSASKGGRRVGR